MSKKRKPTIAAGAVIERALIQRWISREVSEVPHPVSEGQFWDGYRSCLFQLRAWLKAQPTRTARKGGIGR